MAWDHLSVTKAHLVYIILGGFTSLFMLCSSVIKERLYIGEATVATICGIIFGPHAANLINPLDWGNTDLITVEFSRIVLVVQCFAVGVELPKSYMEKHWKSVTLLLIPVMTFGWLITSLFIWWMFGTHLDWLDSLTCAACVTATDPVLASSVVGKGKFAKRVPKHLRDLLSAESGCNDGMAFPFIYLALYLIRYRPDASKVSFHWFCYTILYECVFGCFYGVMVGYFARRAIRWAHEKDVIDRESFLVFYFVLALFCAGSGSILGVDDLLVGFACGVGFSNDGWFLEKTEESHVSNVIDLLINLAFFVYFGTIIPWEQYNSTIIGTSPWRLVVLGILVLFFRRIPIMLVLKPIIPDIKTWREALFAGHFGPIGVGAIFVAILARAELETESTTPLAVLPEAGFEHKNIIELIWPITTFLVIVSIIVHGSSIAVFTLGKHINTLTLTLSYTQANDDGPGWMDRLPRIQSRSKSSMSLRRPSDSDFDEKLDSSGPGLLPLSAAGQFLRRQKDDEPSSRASSVRPSARRRKWDQGLGPGGPISQSAIRPQRFDRQQEVPELSQRDSDTLAINSDENVESGESSLTKEKGARSGSPEEEIFEEGDKTVIEDEEGNVLGVRDSHGEEGAERERHDQQAARRLGREKRVEDEEAPGKVVEGIKEGLEHPAKGWKDMRLRPGSGEPQQPPKAHKPAPKRGPALAYQFGNTIIVEDEDGEVLKKYDIPGPAKQPKAHDGAGTLQRLKNMGSYLGMPAKTASEAAEGVAGAPGSQEKKHHAGEDDDDNIRFTVTAGGRRMSKLEFIQQIQKMDPKSRAQLVENSDVPEDVKREARKDAKEAAAGRKRATTGGSAKIPPTVGEHHDSMPQIIQADSPSDTRKKGPEGHILVDSDDEDVPFHPPHRETGAQRRRRIASYPFPHIPASPDANDVDDEADDEEAKETPAERRRRLAALSSSGSGGRERERERDGSNSPFAPASNAQSLSDFDPTAMSNAPKSHMDVGETAAERRRRLGALGMGDQGDSDSESGEEESGDPLATGRGESAGKGAAATSAAQRAPGIRFAELPEASHNAETQPLSPLATKRTTPSLPLKEPRNSIQRPNHRSHLQQRPNRRGPLPPPPVPPLHPGNLPLKQPRRQLHPIRLRQQIPNRLLHPLAQALQPVVGVLDPVPVDQHVEPARRGLLAPARLAGLYDGGSPAAVGVHFFGVDDVEAGGRWVVPDVFG
ncbi:hypothetical protein BU16DRAFT_553297 [Lophium mytilinum]|uniref:Na+/H+ antiporter-like protein Nha1 n=1 Tax=Lophium mytilinum TaxID=390894 RepID=A0A6A6QCX4_9PEZI|nr:hypothetical protein BU16DRAFT_553297 [Lophium mytilinum]